MNTSVIHRRSLRALDWLNFFVADLQTGFGPFIAVYLTTQKWTQIDIGYVLSLGTLVTIIAQVPAGALVDAMPNKRLAASTGLVGLSASAAVMALWPERLPVILSQAVHAFATCMLIPAIAAMTLNRVGRGAFAERLGRNARFAALGAAAGAAMMGAIGSYVSSSAVFWLAAAFSLPALIAVRLMPPRNLPIDPELAAATGPPRRKGLGVLLDDRLMAFGVCAVLFHLSNAALLPLAAAEVTKQAGDHANFIIAACLVLPQVVVALLSPWVGRAADRWGRRPVLLLGFAALPLRGLLFAVAGSPPLIVATQVLDGVGGATFGVMVPLIAADLTRGTGRFNLCMGVIGLAVGVGATLSTTLGGALASEMGVSSAFLVLAGCGVIATLLVALAMPETRPQMAAAE